MFEVESRLLSPVTRKTQPDQASSEMEATSLSSAVSPQKCIKRLKNKNAKRKGSVWPQPSSFRGYERCVGAGVGDIMATNPLDSDDSDTEPQKTDNKPPGDPIKIKDRVSDYDLDLPK